MRLMVFSSSMPACMASATSSVALVQTSISSERRSSSAIRPLSYCDWTFSACSSYGARMDFLSMFEVMSEMATVIPERVAQLKPESLRLSSVSAATFFGYRSARSLTISESTSLPVTWATQG